ncbi:MAG: galactose oxidase [Candidatus Lokiarchaeota archaeon]|nr:galactose oxidase [Candidatus Lokiarchaeota archaeon]
MNSRSKKILALVLSAITIVSVIIIVIILIPPLDSGRKYPKDTFIWISGDNSHSNNGTYGTKGVADANNMPGARSTSCSWTDSSGNLWLFGGYGFDNVSGVDGYLNDLWKFDGSTWTWVSGNYSRNNSGIYGIKGVADAANMPGARRYSAYWVDLYGNFWLFGGTGYDNVSGADGYLNDLWKYDVGTNMWTWISGNYSRNNNGTYGTKGVANSNNIPGGRAYAPSMVDSSGNLWLFGGRGYDNVSGADGYLNDLWKYDVQTNMWTWISGNYSRNNNGTYGTKGVANSNNIPGGRNFHSSWSDSSGNFWVFGGMGYGNVSSSPEILNDLWKYDIGCNMWTWVSGNYSGFNNGTYGVKGIADVNNVPGARWASATWVDSSYNLWLFGGTGYGNSSTIPGRLNDMWKYDIGSNMWTWMNGNYSINNNGSYGIKYVASSSNVPGGRSTNTCWKDKNGDFWFFGGFGYDKDSGLERRLNDLWVYSP